MPVFPDFDRFFSITEWLNGRLSADDSKFRVMDPDDNTKQIRFDAGSVTTATTRVITAPDADITLLGTASTDTLTNKTLTSPNINGYKMSVLVGASNLTLAEADSGSLIDCGAAEDFVLPALTACNSGTNGLVYEFVVTTTATSLTITAATGDLLHGGVTIMSTAAGAENDAFSADGTDDLVITMNGTTTGGIIGSWVKLWAASATKWVVTGNLIGSGTITTPFS